MPSTEPGLKNSTLQDILDEGRGLTIYCQCGHSLRLSIPKMIDRFGTDFALVKQRDEFLGRFRCNECGKRPYTVVVGPRGR